MIRSALQRVYQGISELPPLKRILISIFSLVTITTMVGFLVIWPRWQQVRQLEQNLSQLQLQLTTALNQARQIDSFRKQMADAEENYRKAAQALPETQEIPSLLAGISQAGHTSALEFLLFEPKGETVREFYAEIPVSISVQGSYHHAARFFDKVARLPRLVNIRDIRIAPPRPGEPLVTTCTAVTYKFVEAVAEPEPAATPARRGAGARRTGAR